MWKELTPVPNEAHFIRAQLQGRRIGSEFGVSLLVRSSYPQSQTLPQACHPPPFAFQ
jgi:hypothetical protein